MRAFLLDVAYVHTAPVVSDRLPGVATDLRLCQHVAFPHPPSLDCAFEGAGKMGHKGLVNFLLFVVVAVALFYFGGVGIEKQVIVAGDVFADPFLDLCDCERVMEALGES